MNNRFHQAIPQSTESYRASTQKQLWLSHQRKQCKCGKTITEKQQRQYGACSVCYQSGISRSISDSAAGLQGQFDRGQDERAV